MYVYRRKLYTLAQAIFDSLALWLIWESATRFRIFLNPAMKLQLEIQDSLGWAPPLTLILLVSIAVSFRFRLYRVPDEIRASTLLSWAGQNTVMVWTLTVVITFFWRELGEGVSRMFVLCMLPVCFLMLVGTRLLTLSGVAIVQRRGHQPRIALLGDLTNAKSLLSGMKSQVRNAIRGIIVSEDVTGETYTHAVPVLGTTRQVAELVNREQIDHVIVLNGTVPDSEFERCRKVFWRMGLPVSCTFDMALNQHPIQSRWRSSTRVDLSKRYGLSLLEVRPRQAAPREDVIRHRFDFALALLSLLLLWPAMALIALAVKLTSEGPALERMSRIGKGGRHFTCFKFRTTYLDGDPALPTAAGAQPIDGTAGSDERRTTPIGKFLCRYAIDELPQLFNILLREMSFVGPRPLPAHALGPDGMSQEFFSWSASRARVRPGLTGLWQVSGRRNLPFQEMIRLDLEYVQRRSLWLDINIIVKTLVPLLRAVGANELSN